MNELHEKLISLFLLDSTAMTHQQAQQLSDWIKQSPENANTFILSTMFHRQIHDTLVNSDAIRNVCIQTENEITKSQDSELLDPKVWEMLSEIEMTAPTIPIILPKKQPPAVAAEMTRIYPRKINKYSLITAITSIAALLFLVIFAMFSHPVQHEEVATVVDMINGRLVQKETNVAVDTRLSTNSYSLKLTEGVVKLRFDNHAVVVIEAPAEFNVVGGDNIKLTYGRIFTSVPRQAIGFTITTPNSKIIDLGTEFGVQTNENGSTELHVFKGKTTLVAGEDEKRTSMVVNGGSAKKIDGLTDAISDITCSRKRFVREIQSKTNLLWRGQELDMTDIVGGGSGVSFGAPKSIIRADGRCVPIEYNYSDKIQASPGNCIPVLNTSMIDSVFIASGGKIAIPITQKGDILWNAPPSPVRQKIGYLRFDIRQIHGNLTGATLGLSVRYWGNKKSDIGVYGYKNEDADSWDETQICYNNAPGFLAAPSGSYALDSTVLEKLGTILMTKSDLNTSNSLNLNLDDFIRRDTNGLLTLVLICENSDTVAEWEIVTKEGGAALAPKLTFPYVGSEMPAIISTAVGNGADTYLSNDNHYVSDSSGENHGGETTLRIRNYYTRPLYITNSADFLFLQNGAEKKQTSSVRALPQGMEQKPVICMRADVGITFDLQAIRIGYDNIALKSFTALFGCSEISPGSPENQTNKINVYVLVNGKERFSKTNISPDAPACPIDIPLSDQDHYLTLITTGAVVDKVSADWGIFAEPRLNLE